MSYSCLRSNADEAYHANCKHGCCGDEDCEQRTGRWRGQTHYPNGQRISFTLSGIYTQDDIAVCKKFGIGVPPPASTPAIGQGATRPSSTRWSSLARAAMVCLPPLALAVWWLR